MADGVGKWTGEDKAVGAAWLMGSYSEVPTGLGSAGSHPSPAVR